MCIYIHLYTYIYIYIHIHAYWHIHIYIYMFVNIYIYIYMYLHIYIYIYIYLQNTYLLCIMVNIYIYIYVVSIYLLIVLRCIHTVLCTHLPTVVCSSPLCSRVVFRLRFVLLSARVNRFCQFSIPDKNRFGAKSWLSWLLRFIYLICSSALEL